MNDKELELLELARLCLRQASFARTPAAAAELQRMAEDYFTRASELAPDCSPRTPGRRRADAAPPRSSSNNRNLSSRGNTDEPSKSMPEASEHRRPWGRRPSAHAPHGGDLRQARPACSDR